MNQQMRVGVIGAGVMGEALISALIASGVKSDSVTISEKRVERRDELIATYGVNASDLAANVASAHAILLVVKPQDMAGVLDEMRETINPQALIVSFAAGKRIDFISQHLDNPVIRVMPNTATMVGAGMAAISLGAGVSPAQKEFVTKFLAATGKVIEVPEDLQDAVTATSGSGPAYFFKFVEAMVAGAQELGLSADDATTLTHQTIIGAAKLLETSGKSATTLRENVTSPNGTTAAALASFDAGELSSLVARAMKAARDRSQDLA